MVHFGKKKGEEYIAACYRRYEEGKRQKARELHKQGKSIKEIAEELGMWGEDIREAVKEI